MANEWTYAALSDQRTTAAMALEWHRLLADRNTLNPNDPALIYAPVPVGASSATVKIPFIGIDGYDLPAVTADGTAASNTAPTDTSVSLTVAKYSKVYTATDLAKFTDPTGSLAPERFAMDAAVSAQVNLVNLIAALGSSASTSVGSTGVNMTYANFLAAKSQLEIANVPGPYLAILHPVQVADLRLDIAFATQGAIQWQESSGSLIDAQGNGYVTTIAGVRIFSSSKVPTANAGADRAGFMVGRGGIAWTDLTPAVEFADRQILIGKVLFEAIRNGTAASTSYASHYWCAAGVGQADALVGIVTDA